MRPPRPRGVAAAVLAAAGLAGCGGDPGPPTTVTAYVAATGQAPDPHRVATAGEALLHAAVHRRLYAYRPGRPDEPVADLAEGRPEISEDGRTVRVRVRGGVEFWPAPRREVTAFDVERGIERALGDPVAGPQARRLLGAVEGLAPLERGAIDVPGVQAADDRTLELRLTRRQAPLVIAALASPASTPIPPLGPRAPGYRIVATGPYVPFAAGNGAQVLVRNPGWDRDTDFRPARLDRIVVRPGRAERVAPRVLDGDALLLAEGRPPESVARRAARRGPGRLVRLPVPVTRSVSFAVDRAPLDDPDVRRAVLAAVDREALRTASGTPGALAAHWLAPPLPGFDASGGRDGTGFDFLAQPEGDLALAREYVRRSARPSGRVGGRALIAAHGPDPGEAAVARALREQLVPLGLRLRIRRVGGPELRSACARADLCVSSRTTAGVLDPEPPIREAVARAPTAGLRRAMGRAAREEAGRERNEAWARVNRRFVQRAPGLPWQWEQRLLLAGREVAGAPSEHLGTWDLAFTRLDDDPPGGRGPPGRARR